MLLHFLNCFIIIMLLLSSHITTSKLRKKRSLNEPVFSDAAVDAFFGNAGSKQDVQQNFDDLRFVSDTKNDPMDIIRDLDKLYSLIHTRRMKRRKQMLIKNRRNQFEPLDYNRDRVTNNKWRFRKGKRKRKTHLFRLRPAEDIVLYLEEEPESEFDKRGSVNDETPVKYVPVTRVIPSAREQSLDQLTEYPDVCQIPETKVRISKSSVKSSSSSKPLIYINLPISAPNNSDPGTIERYYFQQMLPTQTKFEDHAKEPESNDDHFQTVTEYGTTEEDFKNVHENTEADDEATVNTVDEHSYLKMKEGDFGRVTEYATDEEVEEETSSTIDEHAFEKMKQEDFTVVTEYPETERNTLTEVEEVTEDEDVVTIDEHEYLKMKENDFGPITEFPQTEKVKTVTTENEEETTERNEERTENHEETTEYHEESTENQESTEHQEESTENNIEVTEYREETTENLQEMTEIPELNGETTESSEETTENHEETTENHEEEVTTENHGEEVTTEHEESTTEEKEVTTEHEEVTEEMTTEHEEVTEEHEESTTEREEVTEEHEEVTEQEAVTTEHEEVTTEQEIVTTEQEEVTEHHEEVTEEQEEITEEHVEITEHHEEITESVTEENTASGEQTSSPDLSEELPLKNKAIILTNNCNINDFLTQNQCICSVKTMLKDITDDLKDINTVKSYDYDCTKFIHIEPGIVITNPIETKQFRKRRIDDFLKWFTRKSGNRVGRDIESLLKKDLDISGNGNKMFVLTGSTITIPCTSNSDVAPESNPVYTWSINNGAPETVGSQTNNGSNLVVDSISPQDSNNYTCTVKTEDEFDKQKQYNHEVIVVAIPTYRLTITIALNSSKWCDPGDLDRLAVSYPGALQELLCNDNTHICNINVEKPQCLLMDLDHEISMHATLSVLPLSEILHKINPDKCDLVCQSKVYSLIVGILLKNFASVTNMQVIFRFSTEEKILTPLHYKKGDKTNAFVNSIMTVCPAGFGIYDNPKLCYGCEPYSFNAGDAMSCSPCPRGTYQPSMGSHSCLPCTSPLQDASCVLPDYMAEAVRKYYIIPFVMTLIIFITITVCVITNRYSHKKLKHRRKKIKKNVIRLSNNNKNGKNSPPELPPMDF